MADIIGKFIERHGEDVPEALESQSHRKRDNDEQGDEAGGDDGAAPTFDSRL
ncbi:hypothetical protein [Bifidobacterium bifidum]|uniref:hypothetical protein n=1 Tax=Bifidobacterium bifidum TaxID=1681 RepID=UPI004025AB15